MSIEQKLREAAAALLAAITEARAQGLTILWPGRAEGLAVLAISETARVIRATVTNLDGSPVERDADGKIAGQPLDLTDEQRAALPPLDPNASDDPAEYIAGEMDGGSTKPARLPAKPKKS